MLYIITFLHAQLGMTQNLLQALRPLIEAPCHSPSTGHKRWVPRSRMAAMATQLPGGKNVLVHGWPSLCLAVSCGTKVSTHPGVQNHCCSIYPYLSSAASYLQLLAWALEDLWIAYTTSYQNYQMSFGASLWHMCIREWFPTISTLAPIVYQQPTNQTYDRAILCHGSPLSLPCSNIPRTSRMLNRANALAIASNEA